MMTRNLSGFALFILTTSISSLLLLPVYAHKGPHLDEDTKHNSIASTSVEQLKVANTKAPHDANIAMQLAKEFIQIARDEENPEYYYKAKAVLRPWWRTKYLTTQMRLIRATLLQHEHKYQPASADLEKVIKVTPSDAQAWLTLSAIQIIQGDYKKAKKSCNRLAQVASSWFALLCHSQILSFTGNAEKSLAIQKNLLQQLGDKDIELRLWVLSLMAETSMRIGDENKAEINFNKALKLKANDHYVLRTYSDFLLSKKYYHQVLYLLKDQTKNNSLLLRQAIAAKRLNKQKLQNQWVSILEKRFNKASLSEDHTHDRDESLYQLEFKGNTRKALELAQSNWQHQKEPDDALMLLHAAFQHKSPKAIKVVKDWVNKYRLEDRRLQKYLN